MTYTVLFSLPLLFLLAMLMLNEYRSRGVTIYLNSLFWILIIYSLVPAIISFGDTYSINRLFVGKFLDLDNVNAMLVVAIGIIFFVAGHYISKKVRVLGAKSFFLVIDDSELFDTRVALFLAAIGAASYFIFVISYGGFEYVLSNVSAIRSGVDENKNYFGAFVKIFTIYLQLSFYILLVLALRGKWKKRGIFFKIIFFVVLFFVILKLYTDGGRQVAINFVISCLCIFYAVKRRVNYGLVVSGVVFAVLYILYGKIFVFAVLNPDFDAVSFIYDKFWLVLSDGFDSVISEFTHQYLSLINLIQHNFDYRLFGDYFYWMLKPLKLFGYDVPDSISYFNTYQISGVWGSDVPPGLIAFGYASLGIAGVILHAFALGFLLQKVDSLFLISKQPSALLVAFYALLVADLPYLVSNSDPALFIQGRIPHLVFIVALMVLMNRRIYMRRV